MVNWTPEEWGFLLDKLQGYGWLFMGLVFVTIWLAIFARYRGKSRDN